MKFKQIKCYRPTLSTEKALNPYFHILEDVRTNPYLEGYIFSEDLSFSAHISTSTKKANRMLEFIQANHTGCPQRPNGLGYVSMVRSGLE